MTLEITFNGVSGYSQLFCISAPKHALLMQNLNFNECFFGDHSASQKGIIVIQLDQISIVGVAQFCIVGPLRRSRFSSNLNLVLKTPSTIQND